MQKKHILHCLRQLTTHPRKQQIKRATFQGLDRRLSWRLSKGILLPWSLCNNYVRSLRNYTAILLEIIYCAVWGGMPTFRAFDKQQVSSEPLQSRTHHKMKVIVTSNYIMNNDERYFTHLKCFFALRLTIDHGPQSNKWGPLSVSLFSPILSFWVFGILYFCSLGFLTNKAHQPWCWATVARVAWNHPRGCGTWIWPFIHSSAQVLLPHLQVIWERRHSNSKRLFAYCIYMHILCPLVS